MYEIGQADAMGLYGRCHGVDFGEQDHPSSNAPAGRPIMPAPCDDPGAGRSARRSPPGARNVSSSPERPGSAPRPEVWARDAAGDQARRISRTVADQLVSGGLAERVSAAGHVRLKLGIRFLPNGEAIHGIAAVELSRFYRGDAATARDMRSKDRRAW